MTFNLYSNPTGRGTPLFTDAQTSQLSGSGVATSAGYTATATGTDYWVATYNGDSNNNSVTSGTAAEPVTVTPASPAINTSQQPARRPVRHARSPTQATVSGGYNPTGTVTFNLYSQPRRPTGTPLYHRRQRRRLVGGDGHLGRLHGHGDRHRLLGGHLQRRLATTTRSPAAPLPSR